MAFKLKDGSGVEHTYDQTKLKIPSTTEGETVVFTEGEAQAEKTIDIAENGAFTVEPDAGYTFVKKVSGTVAVPAPVTSVNGKTGDVKTGMTINFTMSTNGTLSSDVPFADALSFIQGFASCPPSITAKTIDADNELNNYIFTQYQIVSSSGGENQIIFFDGKNLKNTLMGLSGMLIWSTNKVTLFSYSTASSVVLLCQEDGGVWVVDPLLPTDNSAFSAFDGGMMELMSSAVTAGNYPAMLVLVGDNNIPAYFSGFFGESMVFRSRELDGTVKVITGTAGTSGISWVVTEEPASVFIVDYDPTHTTGNKTYAEIKNAIISGRPVFCSVGSQVLLLSCLSATTSESSGSDFLFSSSEIYGEQIYVTVAKVTKTDEWTVNTILSPYGIQYESPSGKKFTIKVADDGTLSTKEVTS